MKTILLILALSITSACFAEPFTLYFIRHAEKDLTTKQDPDLTEQGKQTASLLNNSLHQKALTRIYSSNYKRTINTALPVARQHDLELTMYNPRELETLASKLLSQKENALIVGHSNTTPVLVNLVGGQAEPMSEDEYGDLFIITIDTEHKTVNTVVKELK